MANPQPNEQARSHAPSYGEVIYAQYKDLQGRLERVEKELDRTNMRIDRLETKIDKLDQKFDDLRRDLNSSTRHGQIADISTIGIALAVIYFVATH